MNRLDIMNNSHGDGQGHSVFGEYFPDESFSIAHDKPGILVRIYIFNVGKIMMFIIVDGEYWCSAYEWFSILCDVGTVGMA